MAKGPKVNPSTEPGAIIPNLNEAGHEIPDPTPLVMPAGFRRPETLAEQVQRLVRTSISAQAAQQGQETFEESEDFEVDDDPDMHTPYETFFDPVLGKDLSPQEFKDHEAHYRRQYIEAQRRYFQFQDRQQAIERALSRGRSAEEGVSPSSAPHELQTRDQAPGGSRRPASRRSEASAPAEPSRDT